MGDKDTKLGKKMLANLNSKDGDGTLGNPAIKPKRNK